MSPLYRVLALRYCFHNRYQHWRVFEEYFKQYHSLLYSFKHVKTLVELIFGGTAKLEVNMAYTEMPKDICGRGR